MGSAQSARRIQPGGARPAVPRRADLFPLPVPPDPSTRARPSPSLALSPEGGAGAARARAGPGVGSAGDRPAAGDRPPPGALPPSAVRRDRLRDGREGPAGEGGSGGAAPPVGAEPPRPECYSPLGSSSRRIPGPREPDHPSPRSPPSPSPRPSVTRGRSVSGSGGVVRRPGRPSHGATALPPLSPFHGGPGGRGGLSSVRPGRRRAVGPWGVRRSRRALSPLVGEPVARAHGVGGDVGHPPDPS